TACGVGGGGIYVPLGILLLAFAPKPSSGLSQASIFGASLGGLILNIQNKHPFTYKVEDNTTTEQETILSVPTTDHTPDNTDSTHYYTRPLIDYDMALFLAPMEMAGAVLGVLIQKVLPNWLYLIVAAVILGFTAYKTYRKWWDSRDKEKRASEATLAASAAMNETTAPAPEQETAPKNNSDDKDKDKSTPSETSSLRPKSAALEIDYVHEDSSLSLDNGGGDAAPVKPAPSATEATHKTDEEISDGEHLSHEGEVVDAYHDLASLDSATLARRNYLLERDARQYPAEKLLVFCVLWAGLTLLTFFKGGKGVDSIVGITCEDPWYGVLIAIQFLWTLGFATFFAWKLLKDTEEKQAVGYPFHPQDVMWDFPKTRFYAFFTFVAGIVAGLVSAIL
ncbi:MAG: hypothetical protein SGILL_004439, partial [Bacillariaceae sp.]